MNYKLGAEAAGSSTSVFSNVSLAGVYTDCYSKCFYWVSSLTSNT